MLEFEDKKKISLPSGQKDTPGQICMTAPETRQTTQLKILRCGTGTSPFRQLQISPIKFS